MIGFLTFIHVVICILLVVSILMQAGKGGGLAEGFSSAENLLGAQTNAFMVRVTTILAILFLVTSLTLALLNSRTTQSLMTRVPPSTKTKTVDVDDLFKQKATETITINAAEPVTATSAPAMPTNSVAK